MPEDSTGQEKAVILVGAIGKYSTDFSFGNVKFDLNNAGKTYTYRVTESGTIAGVKNDPKTSRTIKLTVVRQEDNSIKVVTDETSESIEFTNTYSASGFIGLVGKKSLTGREFKKGDEFTFTVTSLDGGKLPNPSSVTIKPTEGTEAEFTFNEIAFDESDVDKTYTYNVVESGKGDGITNDSHTHVVTVTITDPNKDGNLIVTKTYKDGDHLAFVNTYENKVYVSKTDITGENELAGAVLSVIDKTGNVVDTWTSEEGKSHKIDSDKLMGGETYTLHEELPPVGYAVAQDVTFTVNTDGKIQTVYMRDEVTPVYITKTDITGSKELGGAKLEVRDEDNKIIESWTSEEGKTHEIHGKLIAGKTYTLHEEIAPDGYVVANDIVFTVKMDGTPTTVLMKDETTKVHVTKTDITGSKELGGAKLVVKDKNG